MTPPLAGVRVLDLTRLLPGNHCNWLLASLGADVVKIEDPGAGDYHRAHGHPVNGQSAAHHLVNRGKRSAVLDLKNPLGRAALLRLVDNADVLVESFRSGVLDRLGLGERVLRERRPSLVTASISAYGATGPLAGVAAHDINALALSGVLDRLVGRDEQLPPQLTLPLADLVGGALTPCLGILALLVRARETGVGGWLDASLLEGVALLPSLLVADVLAGVPLPPHNTEADRPYHRVYRLADGLVAIGAVEEQFWARLCHVLGEPELVNLRADRRRWPELTARLTMRFGGLTRAGLAELTAGQDACVTILQDYPQLFDSGYAAERDLVRPAARVTVPRVLHWSEDPGPFGAPYIMMVRHHGRVPADDPPYCAKGWVVDLPLAGQRRLVDSAIGAVAGVHETDWRRAGLEHLAEPELGPTALEQQIERFRRHYEWAKDSGPSSPTIDRALEWIADHLPDPAGETVLSWGDSRLANLMFDDRLEVSAVLDWEMAGLGPRGSDIGWFVFTNQLNSEGLGLAPPPGFPSTDQVVEQYERVSGVAVTDLRFYEAWAAVRASILFVRVGKLMIERGHLDRDSDWWQSNQASRFLARLLDVPKPPGTSSTWFSSLPDGGPIEGAKMSRTS